MEGGQVIGQFGQVNSNLDQDNAVRQIGFWPCCGSVLCLAQVD